MTREVTRNEDQYALGSLRLLAKPDGGILVAVTAGPDGHVHQGNAVTFRSPEEGGTSPRTLAALRALMEAIEQDNQEHPVAPAGVEGFSPGAGQVVITATPAVATELYEVFDRGNVKPEAIGEWFVVPLSHGDGTVITVGNPRKGKSISLVRFADYKVAQYLASAHNASLAAITPSSAPITLDAAAERVKQADVDRIGAYWEDQSRRGCVDAFPCALKEAWGAGAAHQASRAEV